MSPVQRRGITRSFNRASLPCGQYGILILLILVIVNTHIVTYAVLRYYNNLRQQGYGPRPAVRLCYGVLPAVQRASAYGSYSLSRRKLDNGECVESGKIDRLNGENYRTWKFAARMYLIQTDLWPYVNGDAVVKPEATPEEKRQHKNKMEKALAAIALAVEADQQVHIVDCNTAAEAWNILEQVYEPKSRQRIMQIKREFVRIRLKEGETMASYLSRMKIIAGYLHDAGSEMKDEDLAYAMLSGLPDSYDALTMSLTNLEDAKFTSTEIKKMLLMEYERKVSKEQDQEPKGELSAYQVNKKSRSSESKKGDKKCFNCGKVGHFIWQCKKTKLDTKSQKQVHQKESFILSMNVNHTVLDDDRLVDSAATHHVCKNERWFHRFRKIEPEPVGTAETLVNKGEAALVAEGIGHIVLKTRVDGTNYEITLENVYYVPKCKRNLLSIAQVEMKGKTVVFEHGSGESQAVCQIKWWPRLGAWKIYMCCRQRRCSPHKKKKGYIQ